MARFLYTLLWWLALPLILARLWLRGRQEPGYRQHWAERLGCYAARPKPHPGHSSPSHASELTIWVHAVSVGETRASEPLIDALLAHYPACHILLTHMTPTGRAAGKALYAKHGARLSQSYLPYDTPGMVRRFIEHHAPSMCILMETEVWPNLIAVCAAHKVPVALVNARLSARSLARAQRFGTLMMDAARAITIVAAQTEMDAARMRSLGVAHVVVTGSIKFDVQVPAAALLLGAALREHFGPRPVLLCASTRDGEEALILDALQRCLSQSETALPPDILLVLVPRHPQRFNDVANLIAQRGLRFARRSQMIDADAVLAPNMDIVLGDSMGEMFAYYCACDCAFIGGSLLPLGGQNLIEACALGKPVLTGPHTFNFALVTSDAIAAGAAVCIADTDALFQQAGRILREPNLQMDMAHHALAFAAQHGGATQRTLALLAPLI